VEKTGRRAFWRIAGGVNIGLDANAVRRYPDRRRIEAVSLYSLPKHELICADDVRRGFCA
jgi:hypothetical protein